MTAPYDSTFPLLKSLRALAILVAAGMVSACAVNQDLTSDGAPLARQLTASAYCGLTAPSLVYLSSAEDVARFTGQRGQNLTSDTLQEHDFSREHLLVVAMGQKPTGGFAVVLEDARIRDNVLQIRARGQSPGPGDMVTQALTTPCAVLAVTPRNWRRTEVAGEGLPAMVYRR